MYTVDSHARHSCETNRAHFRVRKPIAVYMLPYSYIRQVSLLSLVVVNNLRKWPHEPGLALALANSHMASGCRIWRGLSGQHSPKWLIRIIRLDLIESNENKIIILICLNNHTISFCQQPDVLMHLEEHTMRMLSARHLANCHARGNVLFTWTMSHDVVHPGILSE